MKAEEATTKICPFIPEHLLKFYGSDMCICGGCMAWVYIKKDSNDFMTVTSKSKDPTEEGYCARIGQ